MITDTIEQKIKMMFKGRKGLQYTELTKKELRQFAHSLLEAQRRDEDKISKCCNAKCYADWSCSKCGKELILKSDFVSQRSALKEMEKKV